MSKNEIVQPRANEVAPAGFGSKLDVQAIRDRIMAMMPGAAGAPADVVWAAAQLAVAHRLNPFNGEIYIMPTGRKQDANGQWVDDWRAHVGVKGLRKKAREQAEFMTEFRDMTPDEVRAYRRGDYDPQDIGVECTLYRLDVAQSAKRAGLPYVPFRAVGFWRVKAVYSNKTKTWSEDNIPNTWTAQQVAKKRAEINAIKEAFDLTVEVADPAATGESATFEVIEHQLQQEKRDAALVAQPYAMNDDGLLEEIHRVKKDKVE